MTVFIEVTHRTGEPAWVNPAHIVVVSLDGDEGCTLVLTTGRAHLPVQENAATILAAIERLDPPSRPGA